MSKPWRENVNDIIGGAYDISPGPSWGTIIIDGVTETIDELTYWKSAHQKKIRIIDGFYAVDIQPVEDSWIGDNIPPKLKGKWGISRVVRVNR